MTGTRWQERQRQHFDQRVERYRSLYATDSPFHRRITDRLFALARPTAGEEVLDLGCGWGRTTLPLLAAGCRVTGLDISSGTLDALSARVADANASDRFTAICLAAEELDVEQRFALAIGRGFLHHLEQPLPVLRRVHRALKPGGLALFLDPNPLNPGWLPLHLLHPALSVRDEKYLWLQTGDRVRRLLQQAGFVDVQLDYIGFVPASSARFSRAIDDLEARLGQLPLLRRLALYKIISGNVART